MAISHQPADLVTEQFDSTEASTPVRREQLSTTLAEMMARMRGVEPTDEAFRLYEYLNPEAIDRLFEHAQQHEDARWRFHFDAEDQLVTIRSDGCIRIRRND